MTTQRVFDTVNHDILLKKSRVYDVRDILLKWFTLFPKKRKTYASEHHLNYYLTLIDWTEGNSAHRSVSAYVFNIHQYISGMTSEVTAEAPTEATMVATSGATSEAAAKATTGVVRRGDKRITINSKHQLQKFMADHLKTPLESLNVDW